MQPKVPFSGQINALVLPANYPLDTPKTRKKRLTQNRVSPLISMAERVGFEPTVAINHT